MKKFYLVITLAISCFSANAQSWSPVGSGIIGSSGVYAMTTHNGGTDLYVGGWFTTAGGVAASNIAKLTGTTWSAVGTGTSGGVEALASYSLALYAGGNILTAGGVSVCNIAKWDGAAWSNPGGGCNFDQPIEALTVYGGYLYAAGYFTTGGGSIADGIARWDGTFWTGLGIGLVGTGFALANYGGEIYVGGIFASAGGIAASNIAKWNPGSGLWSALGTGTNGAVYALAVYGTDVYAGGEFTSAGGSAANYIAKWNGVTWSAVGTGMNNYVRCLTVNGTDLYAGGDFTLAGGTTANYVAKWNGSTWSPVAAPDMNDRVRTMNMYGTDLYAGGRFTTASGVAASQIAKLSVALPVELIYFAGKVQENKVAIKWSTASETNNDYFMVEREKGLGNGDWEAIGKVKGEGNSTSIINYSIADEHPYNGINYYRLKQTDFDGKFTYSNTISITTNNEQQIITISPNPFSTTATIIINSELKIQNTELKIYDLLGKEVRVLTLNPSPKGEGLQIARGNLQAGMYFYKVTRDEGQACVPKSTSACRHGTGEIIGMGKIVITD